MRRTGNNSKIMHRQPTVDFKQSRFHTLVKHLCLLILRRNRVKVNRCITAKLLPKSAFGIVNDIMQLKNIRTRFGRHFGVKRNYLSSRAVIVNYEIVNR